MRGRTKVHSAQTNQRAPDPNLKLTFSGLPLLYSGAHLDIRGKWSMMGHTSPKFLLKEYAFI